MFASARLAQRILKPLEVFVEGTLSECAPFERSTIKQRALLLVTGSLVLCGVLSLAAFRVGAHGVPELFVFSIAMGVCALAVPALMFATGSVALAGHVFVALEFVLAAGVIGLTGGAGIGGLMALALVPLTASLLCGFRAAGRWTIAGIALLGVTMLAVTLGVEFPVDPTPGLRGTGLLRLGLEFLLACAATGMLFDWLAERAMGELRAADEARAKQVTRLGALAQLGGDALSNSDTSAVFEHACTALCNSLDVEMAKVLEFDAKQDCLWLRAGAGWDAGLVGNAFVSDSVNSQAGYTLSQHQPVVVENLAREARFSAPKLLLDHDVVSGISVVIGGETQAFGVLGVHSREARLFSEIEVGFVQTVADILGSLVRRERAEAEAARHARNLSEERARSERVLEAIPSILIFVAADGRVERWNRGAEDVLGIEASFAVGWALADCEVAWEVDAVQHAMDEALALGECVQLPETRYTRRDGREGLLELAFNPTRSIGETGRALLIVGAEITGRRHMEALLAQSQKLESLGHLAAGLAHEVNTPAQYVGHNLSFLKEGFEDLERLLAAHEALLQQAESQKVDRGLVASVRALVDEIDLAFLAAELPKSLEQASEGVERITEIVAAMKQFSHPGTRAKTSVDLNAALASTFTVARNEWQHVAELETNYDPDLPPVPCMPGELNQVFLNLVINAVHAIEDACRQDQTAKGRISVRTYVDEGSAVIEIGDSGCGIPEAIRDHVFDPFYTTKEVGRGTGQGLAIARSVIVDQHEGGRIDFESTPGVGTTFVIRLPIDPVS